MFSSSDDRLESAFSDALSCSSAAERQEWLAQLSNEDAALAREVESLLAAHARCGERFEVPANIAYSLLLTTLRDGRRVTESDLAAVLAQVEFGESPDDLGRLGGYALRECVAVGNTGFVFRAWDPQLDRPVAIKVLAPSIAEDAARRREFLNEARLASRIRHPNVVTIFHVSADDATSLVFFVMEWVDGATLQDWLEQHPQPSRDDVLSIVDQIARGLTTIHSAGIVHRDLKPGNILRDASTGHLVIVDFGLAFEGRADADRLAGTPLYMAPEQLLGQSVTARSDLFSLGAIAFQLVYQRHPFAGDTLSEVTARIMRGALELPASDDSHDDALRRLLRKCLAAEPEHRFATAEDFLSEFRAAWMAAGTSTEANATTSAVITPPRWRQFGFWMLLALSGVLLALAVIWFARPPAPAFRDRDTYVNSIGIRFRRIPTPPPIAIWPPFPEHREWTERVDWRNIDRDFFLSESEVTRREFAAVMGVSSSATTAAADQGLPMTGITFDEAETFCRKLTERDRDGWIYHVPWEIEMTYATYGFDLLSRGATPATLLESPPLTQDTIVAARQSNRSALGLLGMSGNVWEWTDATLRKPPQWEGVVSFAATGEIPAEESRFVFGGGARDLFVHAYDMNCGINDFLERAENAHAHTEPDGATKYLCPKSHDQPLRLIYHYTFASPVRSAKLVALLGLHVEQSEFEVRVRKAVRQDSESHVEDWRSVVKHRGLFSARPAEIDLTEPLAGAVEAWLEFRLQADEPPRHYTQFARTSHVLKLPDVVRFEAELEPSPTGPRNQVAVPRSHRSPFIGLRVAMRPARR